MLLLDTDYGLFYGFCWSVLYQIGLSCIFVKSHCYTGMLLVVGFVICCLINSFAGMKVCWPFFLWPCLIWYSPYVCGFWYASTAWGLVMLTLLFALVFLLVSGCLFGMVLATLSSLVYPIYDGIWTGTTLTWPMVAGTYCLDPLWLDWCCCPNFFFVCCLCLLPAACCLCAPC
jgi:hypothetical protein